MLHHIRQLRSVNQGLSSRNLELMSRLQTHQQVLSRMQMLQERLTECEERMAKASSAHQHLAQRGRGSSLIEGHHGDDDGGGGEGKMIDSFNPSSLAREAERAIQDASLEQLGASERILDGVLEKIRQKRQEKIREEQIKVRNKGGFDGGCLETTHCLLATVEEGSQREGGECVRLTDCTYLPSHIYTIADAP